MGRRAVLVRLECVCVRCSDGGLGRSGVCVEVLVRAEGMNHTLVPAHSHTPPLPHRSLENAGGTRTCLTHLLRRHTLCVFHFRVCISVSLWVCGRCRACLQRTAVSLGAPVVVRTHHRRCMLCVIKAVDRRPPVFGWALGEPPQRGGFPFRGSPGRDCRQLQWHHTLTCNPNP